MPAFQADCCGFESHLPLQRVKRVFYQKGEYMNNKNINNQMNKNVKTASSNKNDINRNNTNKNLDNVDNNIKNRKSASTEARSSKPIRVSRIQRDRNYIVLVWQSKINGVIRRVMEVPGTELNRTLNSIRDQRKAFDYYLKR